jgi:hypothetical protein
MVTTSASTTAGQLEGMVRFTPLRSTTETLSVKPSTEAAVCTATCGMPPERLVATLPTSVMVPEPMVTMRSAPTTAAAAASSVFSSACSVAWPSSSTTVRMSWLPLNWPSTRWLSLWPCRWIAVLSVSMTIDARPDFPARASEACTASSTRRCAVSEISMPSRSSEARRAPGSSCFRNCRRPSRSVGSEISSMPHLCCRIFIRRMNFYSS